MSEQILSRLFVATQRNNYSKNILVVLLALSRNMHYYTGN